MEDTEIKFTALTKEQSEQANQIVDIENTSKTMTCIFYVILLICNILLLIFSDREGAGTLVLMVILFMMVWTMFNLSKLGRRKGELLASLRKSGLTHLQMKDIIERIRKERNDKNV